MARFSVSLGTALALFLTSCTSAPPPVVPVLATAPAATALAGKWEGEYSSVQTQRSGTIRFQLAAQSDSAFGDVVMLPKRTPHHTSQNEVSTAPVANPPAQTLSINFVIATGDSVIGQMDPYEDADGSTLLTRFAGLMRGDRIAGKYFTRNLRTSETSTGEWNVRRKKP